MKPNLETELEPSSEVAEIIDPTSPENTRIHEVPGSPIVLADGRTWYLAKPAIKVFPLVTYVPVTEGIHAAGETREVVTVGVKRVYKPPLADHVARFHDALNAAGGEMPYEAILILAWVLLNACHGISYAHSSFLLEMEPFQVENLAVSMLRMFQGLETVPNRSEEPENPSESDR